MKKCHAESFGSSGWRDKYREDIERRVEKEWTVIKEELMGMITIQEALLVVSSPLMMVVIIYSCCRRT
jgi:hypothetical protein